MEIPIISSPDIKIQEIEIPTVVSPTQYYTSQPLPPPVVVNIGVPVVDIPGCVEAHQTNNAKNNAIKEEDPKGTYTICDAGVPSFNPINYEPEQMIFTRPAPVPKSNAETPAPAVPKTEEALPPPPKTVKVECPTKVQKAQYPVGTFIEGYRKKVVGYELIDNTCVQLTEKVALPQQIVAGLPSGGQVVQVGGVAVIATTSALVAKPLADLLLKAVRPAVKKIMKKIASIRGKTPPTLSTGERRAEQRQMNHAVRALRSVFPRKKKKG